MDKSNHDLIWKLMSENEFKGDPKSIDNSWLCSICKNLMADACQSPCSCRYCYRCIEQYLNEGPKPCPGDKRDCKLGNLDLSTEIVRLHRINEKILKCEVICPNEACQSRVVLNNMPEHLNVCMLVLCPFVCIGCEYGEIRNDRLLQHIKNEAVMHSRLLMETINEQKNSFTINKNKMVTLEEQLKEVKNETTLRITEIKGHIDTLNARINEGDALREKMDIHVSDFKEEMKNDINKMEHTIEQIELSSAQKDNKMVTLEEQLKEVKNETTLRITEIKGHINTLNARINEGDALREKMDIRVSEFKEEMKNKMVTLEEQLKEVKNETTVRITEIKGHIDTLTARINEGDVLREKMDIHVSDFKEEMKKETTVIDDEIKKQKREMEKIKEDSMENDKKMLSIYVKLDEIKNNLELRILTIEAQRNIVGEESETNKAERHQMYDQISEMKNEIISIEDKITKQKLEMDDKIYEVKKDLNIRKLPIQRDNDGTKTEVNEEDANRPTMDDQIYDLTNENINKISQSLLKNASFRQKRDAFEQISKIEPVKPVPTTPRSKQSDCFDLQDKRVQLRLNRSSTMTRSRRSTLTSNSVYDTTMNLNGKNVEESQNKDQLNEIIKQIEDIKDEARQQKNMMLEYKKEISNLRSIINGEENNINRKSSRLKKKQTIEKSDLNEAIKMIESNKLNNRNESFSTLESDFVWTVNELSIKMKQSSISSETFYAKYYRLGLCLCIDNIDGNKFTLSAFLIKGENDNILQWPMKQAITLVIIDQDNSTAHKTVTYKYDSFDGDRRAFDRPNKVMNDFGIGEHHSFSDYPFITDNDSIIVTCSLRDQ